MTADQSRHYFDELITWATAQLSGNEILLAHLAGEQSDFARFNHAAVRQAGSVNQQALSIDLISGVRHAKGRVTLTGLRIADEARLALLMSQLRAQRQVMPADPHLLYHESASASERLVSGSLPTATQAVDSVIEGAQGRDLVGLYAAGEVFEGFASSFGQRNWFRAHTFNLDWSLHQRADKATKSSYAGTVWDAEKLRAKLDWSGRELDALGRTPKVLKPGKYRSYLTPAAVQELMGMLAWGGFSLRAHRTKQTPLLRMVTDGASFHPTVSIREDIAGGVAPDFGACGFARPDAIELISDGKYRGHLISPRSAQEYNVTTNGAEDHEVPLAVAMSPGDLPVDNVVASLGTGLYVGNLWYLNFSDRAACRTTGMTRFGTFWVDDGEIVAPIEVLRFDDTVYNLLGLNLVGLTDRVEMILDPSTYERRSVGSLRLPGALVDDMAFTL